MLDITMCRGEGCERRFACYRFVAVPNEHWQSYFVKSPIKNGSCKHFMKLFDDEKHLAETRRALYRQQNSFSARAIRDSK